MADRQSEKEGVPLQLAPVEDVTFQLHCATMIAEMRTYFGTHFKRVAIVDLVVD